MKEQIMKIAKVGAKATVAVAGGVFLGDSVLYKIAMAAICYVLLTYYMWYMKKRGFGFSAFIGGGGLTATLLSFGFMIISPLIPLVILSFILSSLNLPEFVMGALSILLIIAAIGFVIFDIGRAFNPEFLKRGNDGVTLGEE